MNATFVENTSNFLTFLLHIKATFGEKMQLLLKIQATFSLFYCT